MPTMVKELANQTMAPASLQKLQQNDKKISREARQKRLLELKSLRKLLHEKYPVAFDYNAPLPLEKGIHKAIKATFPQFSQTLIREFLGHWVKDIRYLQALAKAQSRFNIQGVAVDPLIEEEKAFTLNLISKKVISS